MEGGRVRDAGRRRGRGRRGEKPVLRGAAGPGF